MIPTSIAKIMTVPVSQELSSAQATPSAIPTSSFETQPPAVPLRGRPPLSLTLILLALCCGFLLLVGVFSLGFIVRNQNIKEWKKDQQSPPQ
jgi:hypothetical protein